MLKQIGRMWRSALSKCKPANMCYREPLENAIFVPTPKGVELGLFEPRSPLPGNGFLKAETKSSKGLRKFKNAVAETESR